MTETTIEIGDGCTLDKIEYDNGATEVYLGYIVKATEYGHPDTEIDHYIDRDKAIEIIELLQDAFGVGK